MWNVVLPNQRLLLCYITDFMIVFCLFICLFPFWNEFWWFICLSLSFFVTYIDPMDSLPLISSDCPRTPPPAPPQKKKLNRAVFSLCHYLKHRVFLLQNIHFVWVSMLMEISVGCSTLVCTKFLDNSAHFLYDYRLMIWKMKYRWNWNSPWKTMQYDPDLCTLLAIKGTSFLVP